MQTIDYEGYFSNGHFYVSGKIVQIPDQKRVFITILDDAPEAEIKNQKRKLGFVAGHLPDSFFDPLPEEELQAWGL